MLNLRELLEKMIQMKASDLHLTAGLPPQYRVDGLIASSDYPVLTPDECTRLAYSVLNEEQKRRFENERELDLSFGVKSLARFRHTLGQASEKPFAGVMSLQDFLLLVSVSYQRPLMDACRSSNALFPPSGEGDAGGLASTCLLGPNTRGP